MFFVMNPRFLPYIGYVTIAMVCTAFSLWPPL
jgi:hypothetical protein